MKWCYIFFLLSIFFRREFERGPLKEPEMVPFCSMVSGSLRINLFSLNDDLLTIKGEHSHERRDTEIKKYQLIQKFKVDSKRDPTQKVVCLN